jgi:hypothetical protein
LVLSQRGRIREVDGARIQMQRVIGDPHTKTAILNSICFCPQSEGAPRLA